jgi:serine O-acetyltransferase
MGYGINLALSAHIGPGLYIGHFGGIELRNCRLGARCSIGQQTKIGRPAEVNGPKIGDRVWIGSHSHVFGAIVIGDGATLGAGALVTTDVSARSLCLGRPARVAMRDYDNSAFL